VFEERGRKCELCGWSERNPYTGIIPVQTNHINGNKKDIRPENLIVLCPNCHSLTEKFMFYGGRHKDQSRIKISIGLKKYYKGMGR